MLTEGIEPLLLPGGIFKTDNVSGLSQSTIDALQDSRVDLGELLNLDTGADFGEVLLELASDGQIDFCGDENEIPEYIILPNDANKTQVSSF